MTLLFRSTSLGPFVISVCYNADLVGEISFSSLQVPLWAIPSGLHRAQSLPRLRLQAIRERSFDKLRDLDLYKHAHVLCKAPAVR